MPIAFTCPHCGAKTAVADQYAGQTGPCARCGKTITIPHPGAPAMERPLQGSSRKRLPALVLVLAAVGVVAMVCGGIMVGLLVPALQMARESARRAVCANNLRQISIGLMNYEATFKCFPPAYVADKDGKPMHSWRVLILPFVEERQLYEQYRFDEPWDGPNNRRLAERMPAVFACPSSAPSGPSNDKTSYLAVVGPGFAFNDGQVVRMQDLTQGSPNVIMVVDVAGPDVNWMEPRDLHVQDLRAMAGQGIQTNHPGGANAAYANRRVDFVPDPLDVQILKGAGAGGPAEMPDAPGAPIER